MKGSEGPRDSRWWWGSGSLVIAFLVSRLIAHLAGVRFDEGMAARAWQLPDLDLLKDRLTETIWYMHGQPPLFGFFTGVVLKLFPIRFVPAIWQGAFLLLSLGATIAMYDLGRWLFPSGPWAWGMAISFSVSPGCLLYENFFFYTTPTMFLVLLSAAAFRRFLDSPDFWTAFFWSGLAAATVLTRSLFHPFWWVVAAILALWWARERGWRTALGIVIPGFAVIGWCLKNLVLFGFFGTSSWTGMNLWITAKYSVSFEDMAVLQKTGVLPPIAKVPPFSEAGDYLGMVASSAPTGIGILDRTKKRNGTPSFHHSGIPLIARKYSEAARILFRERWWDLLMTLVVSARCFCLPPSDYFFLKANRDRIAQWDDLFGLVVHGRWGSEVDVAWLKEHFPGHFATSHPGNGFFNEVGLAACLLIHLFLMIGVFPRFEVPSDEVRLVKFFGLVVGYVTLAGIVGDVGENQRFRFMIEPLIWLSLAWGIRHVYTAWRLRAPRRGECA